MRRRWSPANDRQPDRQSATPSRVLPRRRICARLTLRQRDPLPCLGKLPVADGAGGTLATLHGAALGTSVTRRRAFSRISTTQVMCAREMEGQTGPGIVNSRLGYAAILMVGISCRRRQAYGLNAGLPNPLFMRIADERIGDCASAPACLGAAKRLRAWSMLPFALEGSLVIPILHGVVGVQNGLGDA